MMLIKKENFSAHWQMELITAFLFGRLTKICTIEAVLQDFRGQSYFRLCKPPLGMWLVYIIPFAVMDLLSILIFVFINRAIKQQWKGLLHAAILATTLTTKQSYVFTIIMIPT